MEKEYEDQYMQEHDAKVTKIIHNFMIIVLVWGPTLFCLSYFNIAPLPLWIGTVCTATGLLGWIVCEVLIRRGKIEIAKRVQLIYFQVVIMVTSADMNSGVFITLFAAVMVSTVYMDWKLTVGISFLGFLLMAGAIYPRVLSGSATRVEIYKDWQGFILYVISFVVEYVIMTVLAIVIVRHHRSLLIHFFVTQKEKVSAEATSKAKTGFLANMSHEIRTPINAIIGMDEMILRESREIGIVRYATNIKNASKTLLTIINDILDFSKVESGKMEIVEAPYSTSSMLNDLVTMIQTRANDKGLKLNLDIDERIPSELVGDEVRVRQIITNLLTNAVKYSDEGTVTLRMSSTKISDSQVRLDVAVKDTGIGIAPEDIDKLFETFARVNEEHNHGIEGTGLGLPLTKQFLELMGSELKIDSEVGRGSVFYFGLVQKIHDDSPLGDYKRMYTEALETREQYREAFTAPEARVLVVDDTTMNLEVVKGLIKKTHIRIDTATSGFEALEKVQNDRYDMIFLDHKMPGMDGIETLEKMMELGEYLNADTPVIALTANAVSGAKEYYIDKGFTDYLSKPIQGELLERMLLTYLPVQLIEPASNEEEFEYISELRYPDIDGIDIEEALAYSGGSHSAGIDSLRLYVKEFDEKYNTLIKAYDDDDWNLYQINAHAVKSTSRTIGAVDLSEFAKVMEDAAAANDEMMLETQHGVFITTYKELVDRINKALAELPTDKNETPAMEVLSEEELRALIQSIATGAESFDVDAISSGVDRLANVDITASLKENMKTASEGFDYDGVAEKAKLLLQIIDMK